MCPAPCGRSIESSLGFRWGAKPSVPALRALGLEAAVRAGGVRHRPRHPAGVRAPKAGLLIEVPAVARVIVVLLGLHRLAVQASLVAVPGLVAVAENHVLFEDSLRQFRHRSGTGAFALSSRAHMGFARVRHVSPSPRWSTDKPWARRRFRPSVATDG